jgi:hypothetical protein
LPIRDERLIVIEIHWQLLQPLIIVGHVARPIFGRIRAFWLESRGDAISNDRESP